MVAAVRTTAARCPEGYQESIKIIIIIITLIIPGWTGTNINDSRLMDVGSGTQLASALVHHFTSNITLRKIRKTRPNSTMTSKH